MRAFKKDSRRFLILAILIFSTIYSYSAPHVSALPTVTVYVDPNDVISTNQIQLGYQIGDQDMNEYRYDSELRQLATDANFKLVRFFDRNTNPCTYWNENTQTGTWSWSKTDDLVSKIFQTYYTIFVLPRPYYM